MGGSRVSIVIPCYNTAQFLAETIRSALTQTLPAADIVVVDDASTDGSAEVAEKFPEVRLIRQAKGGVSVARNRGMREATGDFIVFLDSDDRLLPEALEIGAEELRARDECGFVYGFSRSIDAAGAPLDPAGDVRPRVGHADYTTLLAGSGLVPAAAACHRRAAVEAVGGFDPRWRLVQDHDLYMRVARKFPIHCHNQFVVEWRHHAKNNCRISAAATFGFVLATIDAQRQTFDGNAEFEEAALRGRRHWARIFGPSLTREVFASLKRGRVLQSARAMGLVLRHYPQGPFEYASARLSAGTRKAAPHPVPAHDQPLPASGNGVQVTVLRAKNPSA